MTPLDPAPPRTPGTAMLPPVTAAPRPPRLPRPPPRPAQDRFGEVDAFVDMTMRGLSRAELAVWMVLWRDIKPAGTAKTSQEDMARRAGCDVRTVRRAVDRLEALGLLRLVRKGRIGAGPSVYRVRGVCPT